MPGSAIRPAVLAVNRKRFYLSPCCEILASMMLLPLLMCLSVYSLCSIRNRDCRKLTFGRLGCRNFDRNRQNSRNPARCQETTVSGFTMIR
jgi:hypothetical protein